MKNRNWKEAALGYGIALVFGLTIFGLLYVIHINAITFAFRLFP